MATIVAPGRKKIALHQGATFYVVLLCVDAAGDVFDLTSTSARMKIRSTTDSDTELLSLAVGSGVTITAGEGKIEFQAAATVTAALDLEHYRKTWVYDIELVHTNGFVRRLLSGPVEVYPEVTR